MKKIVITAVVLAGLYLAYIIVSLSLLPPVKELADRKRSITIEVRDWKGKPQPFVLGPKNRSWVPLGSIPAEMKWAVILAEDSNFYKHEGIDVTAIKQAIKYDLEKKSLARGASTITQQVAKNIYLSREKTITRKLKEVYLAWRMEQELTKGRILELYLNLVELGPMVYGVGHGAQYYFGKSATQMTPRECAFLAAMLPGPRIAYNPYRNLGKVLRRSDMILRNLRSKGVISSEEYQAALAQEPNIKGLQRKVDRSLQQEPVQAVHSSAQLPVRSEAPQESPGQTVEPSPAAQQVSPPARAEER